MSETLHLSARDLADRDGRFDRFELIGWWDQKKLAAARVLVVGAGALGNEIVKNLSLLGVGNILVCDLDRIENSNLSRSVLYRPADTGRFKADVAVEAARNIYPDLCAQACVGDVIHDVGAAIYRWADVVIGGLDNREARLSINRNAWRFGKPWVDGAIEQIQGVARVFVPDAAQENACYECTLSERDWQLIAHRRSCNLLTREEMSTGRTPTTPTISSIIAGVQCQEAVKLLHGLPTIAGQGLVFEGLSSDSYLTTYQRREDCLAHETLDAFIDLEKSSETMTLATLLAFARDRLGPATVIELGRDMVSALVCPACDTSEAVFLPLGKVKADRAACPKCGGPRSPALFHAIRGDEDFLGRTVRQAGIPPFDVVVARGQSGTIALVFSADAPMILGPLVKTYRTTWDANEKKVAPPPTSASNPPASTTNPPSMPNDETKILSPGQPSPNPTTTEDLEWL